MPQGCNDDDSPAHVSPLAHQMDFPLVPVVHDKGQLVGCSDFSSIPGGRDSLIHLTGTTVSAGVPEEMSPTTQKKRSLTMLLNVCQVLGIFTYYYPRLPSSEAPFISLGEGTLPSYIQRKKGLWSQHLDSE